MSVELNRKFEPSGNEVFDELMADFSESMHSYRMMELECLMNENSIEIPVRQERLSQLDLSVPLDQQPNEIAVDALAVYMYNRKFSAAQHRLKDIELKWKSRHREQASSLLGKRVTLTTLNPSRNTIGTVRLNQYDEFDGMSQYHETATGKLSDLRLSLQTGGSALLKKPFSRKHYMATRLISRDIVRSPEFKVEFHD